MERRFTYASFLVMAIAARSIYLSLQAAGLPTRDQPKPRPSVPSSLSLATLPSAGAELRQPGPGAESLHNDPILGSNASRNDELECLIESSSHLLPRFPSFIIAGAQKGGTSALFRILQQHPNFVSSPGLELHFFDRRGGLEHDPAKYNATTICQARRKYWQLFDAERARPHDTMLLFEKTPSYMVYPHVPALIKLLCPWTKIIVSLRNPVDRLHSSYLGDDFESDLERQLNGLRRGGLSTAPSLASFESCEDSLCNRTNSTADPRFALTRRIRQVRHQKGRVAANGVFRGFYALQLAHWLPHFSLGSTLKVIRYDDWERRKPQVLKELLAFVGAPPHRFDEQALNAVYGPNNGPQRTFRRPLRNITRTFLKELYRPYNEELAKLLGDEWRGVWD